MKTFLPKPVTSAERKWFVVDATDIVLGKLATEVTNVLRGKNKPVFTHHLDLGDYVIILNAEKIRLTGKKMSDKIYYKHTGYIGHLRQMTAEKVMEKNPAKILELAIRGMMPANKLRKEMMKRLKVVVGSEHQYNAQKPEVLSIAN